MLPGKAIRELGDEDFRDYIVVRVADEILVDIMTAACGVEYKEASAGIEWATFEGVPIRLPLLSSYCGSNKPSGRATSRTGSFCIGILPKETLSLPDFLRPRIAQRDGAIEY